MPRGRSPHAAGPASTGTAPILAQIARAISNRHTRKIACRAARPSSRITAHEELSNRHLVRLKFHATQEESTTSLFLIDPKQQSCSRGIACRAACAFPSGSPAEGDGALQGVVQRSAGAAGFLESVLEV